MKLTAHISWLDLNEKAKSNGDDFFFYKDTCSKFCWSSSFYSDSDFYGVWSSHHVLVRHIGNNLHTCPILVLFKTIDLVQALPSNGIIPLSKSFSILWNEFVKQFFLKHQHSFILPRLV